MRAHWVIREASKLLDKMIQVPRWQRLLRPLFNLFDRAVRSRYPIVWMLPLALAVQWLPLPVAIRSFETADRARDLLGTVLTVIGAVQALAIAVIVFAAQAYASSRYGRYGGSLTDFARNIGLLLVLNFGIVVLIAGGLSFVGFGSGSPGGWAGTWSVILSGSFVLFLPTLYWRTLRAIDPDRLIESKLKRARQLTEILARDNALLYLAEAAIDERCTGCGIERELFRLSPVPDDAVALRAGATGQVKDVNLRAIGVLGDLGRAHRAEMKLLVALKTSVQKGEPLAAADGDITAATMRPGRFVKIGSPERDAALVFLDELHEEALDAVRSGLPSWYQSIADMYAEYTLGPARRISEFGLPADAAFGIRTAIFARTPLDRVSRYMYEELVEAVSGRARETAFDAIYLPRRIAQEAASLRSIGLFQAMTRLYPAVYAALKASPEAPLGGPMSDRTWRHLVEIIEYPIGRDLLETSDHESLTSLSQLVAVADHQMVELLKDAVSFGDRGTFDSALGGWVNSLRFWEPETARPSMWEVKLLRETHGDTDEVKGAEARARLNQLAAEAKTQLTSDRQRWLFGLAMWALRATRMKSGPSTAYMFLSLQEQMNSRDDVLAAANRALNSFEGHSFSSWLMMEQPDRTIHVGGADTELLAAFIAILLVRAASDQITDLPPLEWLAPHLTGAIALVSDLTADGDLMSALHIEDPEGTGSKVQGLLEASARSQRELEEEHERRLTVSDDVRRTLQRHAEAGWKLTRFASRVFEAVHRSGPAASAEDVRAWRTEGLVPKMFLQVERSDDLNRLGSNIGRQLSHGEVSALLDAVSSSPSTAATNSDLQLQVADVVRTMRAEGYAPTIVLLPVEWRLHKDLGLDWRPEGHPPAPASLGLPPQVVVQHLGTLEGVAAFYSTEVGDQAIYIIDLAALGAWHFAPDHSEQAINVEVTEFDEQSSGEGRDESQAAKLMKSALVVGNEEFAIDVEDLNAARIVHIVDEGQPDLPTA